MAALGVREEDLDESFTRASGPGGQKVNKTSCAVLLVHRPSGIQVKCAQGRSQALNRFLARRTLCDKLESAARAAAEQSRRETEKDRRRNRPRPRAVKEAMVEEKRRRAVRKALRASPKMEDA